MNRRLAEIVIPLRGPVSVGASACGRHSLQSELDKTRAIAFL
jgi:hypothetical protein